MVQLCWILSHIDVAGNERAVKLAKQAALSQDDLAYELYPYRDFYPVIKKAILNKWQGSWDTVHNNKLKAIKISVKRWPSSNNKIRNDEVVLARLRIGHTRLTHGYLKEQRQPPYCDSCIVPRQSSTSLQSVQITMAKDNGTSKMPG